MLRAVLVLLVVIVAILLVVFLAGCTTLHVEGECTYTRKVEAHYQCQPGSAIEHTRVAPHMPNHE